MPTWNDSMNRRQEKVRRKWKMSGNVWMFSDEIDDEDWESNPLSVWYMKPGQYVKSERK